MADLGVRAGDEKAMKSKKKMHRINLVYPQGITRSVFYKARSRESAVKTALRRNPTAIGTSRSPFS